MSWFISALLGVSLALPVLAADQARCRPGQYYSADRQCRPVQLAHTVYQPQTCYSIDWGQPVALGKNDWGLFYGAVTNKTGVRSCEAHGYSEDIFFLSGKSPLFGRRHGQPVLTSLDLAKHFGVGAMRRDVAQPCAGRADCSGYNIGEPAVLQLPEQWLMFFDSQSCLQAQHNDQFGLIVAASAKPDRGWRILRRLDGELPGKPPLRFPKTFHDPNNGKAYVIYQDAEIHTFAAEISWRNGRLQVAPANQGQPILPQWAVNTLEIFYVPHQQRYYAITDQHGKGDYESLNTLWLLGPSTQPTQFDWATRRPLLQRADWYSGHLRSPSALVRDGKVHVAFWGKALGGHDSSCAEPRSVKMGWLEHIQLPEAPSAPPEGKIDGTELVIDLPQQSPAQRLFIAQPQEGGWRVYGPTGWSRVGEYDAMPSLPASSRRISLPADLSRRHSLYLGVGRDINEVLLNNRYRIIPLE